MLLSLTAGYWKEDSEVHVVEAKAQTLDVPGVTTKAYRPLDALRAGTTKSLNAALLERLREDLLSGVYEPGSKLKIPDICESYRVTPGAAREALSRLVSDGLVDFVDQRGFRVPGLSAKNVMDITRVRLLIEREAIVDAISHGDDNWEAEIVAAHHRLMRCSRDVDQPAGYRSREWTAKHKEFHQALIAGCTSPWLIRLHNNLYDQTERFRSFSARAVGNTPSGRDVHKEHSDIVDAVLQRDKERAVALIEMHLSLTAGIVVSNLQPE